MNNSAQVNFHYRAVNLALKLVDDLFELEYACAFDKNNFVLKLIPIEVFKKVISAFEELTIVAKKLPMCA